MSEQVIKLSDNAANRIKEIMLTADSQAIGVRVGVKSGGCAGMSYIMEYAKEIKPNEEVIEDKGVKVLIDPKAIMYLLGTEMDYKKEKFSSQFVFKNPNETERCGCGESFKISQVVLSQYLHVSIALDAYLIYRFYMNKFEFKNLVKNLKDSLKEKTFFKELRKEVETGANGTQDYVVKKGVNKDTIATTRQ